MEYKIVSGLLKKPLKVSIGIVDVVNKAMQDGWKPTGGLCMYGNTIYQALIRGETNSEEPKE